VIRPSLSADLQRCDSRHVSSHTLLCYASRPPSLPPSLPEVISAELCDHSTAHFFGRLKGGMNLVKRVWRALALSARHGKNNSKAHRVHGLSHRLADSTPLQRNPSQLILICQGSSRFLMSPFSIRISCGIEPRFSGSQNMRAVLLLASLAAAAAFTSPLAPSFARPRIPAVKIDQPQYPAIYASCVHTSPRPRAQNSCAAYTHAAAHWWGSD
jgi:hypothetical protein